MAEKPKCFKECKHERCQGNLDTSGNCDAYCHFCLWLCDECDKERFMQLLAMIRAAREEPEVK